MWEQVHSAPWVVTLLITPLKKSDDFVRKGGLIQGPLITDGRNSCKWTGPTVGLSKSFIRVKISGQNY